MSKVLVTESYLSDIADAIRTKSGGGTTYKPSEMAQGILDIPSGGGWTTDGIASGAEPNGDIEINANGDITTIALRAFGNKRITSVTIHGTPYIGNYAFTETSLTQVSMPDMVQLKSSYYSVSGYIFSRCTSLTAVNAPNLQIGGTYTFQNCTALNGLVLPSLKEAPSNMCVGAGLQYADFGNSGMTTDQWLRIQAFNSCSNLTVLVLRAPFVARLENISAFQSTPFASGKTGGTLYVPSSLVSSYQSATNWSTILSYTNNQILPIEGSYYETHYADGTEIL